MTSSDLIRESFLRLKKYRLALIAGGVAIALLALFYGLDKRATYTARATLFPLTSSADNAVSTNMLSGILGINGAPNSFSSEAAINIVELANSRSIREAVAVTKLPEFGNKTITELLINDINGHMHFWSKPLPVPADSISVAIAGGELLLPDIYCKMSKNGVLELFYTNAKKEFITPVSNVLIDKLSKFYIDLKKRKAQDDYNFAVTKIDSLQRLINTIDRNAIGMQRRTMFTPSELLEYSIPKESISTEKTRLLQQRETYINNREESVWRLQKNTPIIAVLDKPAPPFDKTSPSIILSSIVGLFAGIALVAFVLLSGLLYRYLKSEVYKSIFEK